MVDKTRSNDFAKAKDRLDEIGHRLGELFGRPKSDASVFAGLGNLIEQLGKLAEQAERAGGTSTGAGEFELGPDKRVKGVYGFSVRSALGDKGVKIEPFGNMRRDEGGKLVAVPELREPLVDVFDEPGRLLVVAEVPGVEEEDVQLEVHDDILLISTEKGEPRFRKEVLLPGSFSADQLSFHCRNGILEIQLSKDGAKG